jgi:CelD/BcsL family acetyltransferase involved in cellulose biosynthesis
MPVDAAPLPRPALPHPALPGSEPALETRVLAGAEALAVLAEAGGAATPFQGARWLGDFLRAHGRLDDFRLVSISDAAGNAIGLPLLRRRRGGFTGERVGERHGSFFFPLVTGAPGAWPARSLRKALITAGRAAGIDAFLLAETPLVWRGQANPLIGLSHQAAPSEAAGRTLVPGAEPYDADRDRRRKLRQKAARLAALGEIRTGWVNDAAAIDAALAQCLVWKAGHLHAMGIADPFAGREIRAFLTAATRDEAPAIRLHALHAGERLLAVLIVASGGECVSGMVSAYDPAVEVARNSPGEVLLSALLATLQDEGIRHFDLGVGEAHYKHYACPEAIAMADIALPVTLLGQLIAAGWRGLRALKRSIKRNETAFGLVRRLRRGLARTAP